MSNAMNRKVKIPCDANIEGPKVGVHCVAWRRSCKRPVKSYGKRCFQHRKHGCTCGNWLDAHEPMCPLYTMRGYIENL